MGCSCQQASPDLQWPVSPEPPAGSSEMSWWSVCVWDAMSFPPNVLQRSLPVEIRNPNNIFLFSIVVVSQSSGSPQLSIRFVAANSLEGPITSISGPTSITTLGKQNLGPVTGITYRYVWVEMMSSSGMALCGDGCFCISEG